MAWAACGNPSPAATVTALTVRFSIRPWPWLVLTWPTGTSFQGSACSVACRVGWLPFTVTSRCAPRACRNSAWLVWACRASTVTSTSVRSSTWSSRSLNRATSLVLASTSTWATTTPRPCSTAASRCTGRLPRPGALRVARSALPSTASTSRGRHRPGTTGVVLASTDRSHAPSACCNPAASTRVRTCQNVTGSGTAPVRPSCERCWAGRSTAQSATAANERAPAMTAHTATARSTANGYLTPRRARGSGVCARASTNSTRSRPVTETVKLPGAATAAAISLTAAQMRDDDTAGTPRPRSRSFENFMIYTQVVPASHLTPACHPPCPPRSWPFPRTTQWPCPTGTASAPPWNSWSSRESLPLLAVQLVGPIDKELDRVVWLQCRGTNVVEQRRVQGNGTGIVEEMLPAGVLEVDQVPVGRLIVVNDEERTVETRVRPHGKGKKLHGDVRQPGDLDELFELLAHGPGPADHPAQDRLVDDCPQYRGIRGGEKRLTLHAELDPALDLLGRQVETDLTNDGTRIVGGLQQSREDHR